MRDPGGGFVEVVKDGQNRSPNRLKKAMIGKLNRRKDL
jgi:hypothetical protein